MVQLNAMENPSVGYAVGLRCDSVPVRPPFHEVNTLNF